MCLNYLNFLNAVELIETALQKKFNEKQLAIYYQLLQDLDDETFLLGIKRLLQERVYTNIPSIADIREYSLNIRESDLVARSRIAKNKLKEAVRQFGYCYNIVFDDPVLHLMVQDLGGWVGVCNMKEKDFYDYIKFDFDKVYSSFAKRENTGIPLLLNGGLDQKTIVYIGDANKIERWQKKYIEKYGYNKQKINYTKKNLLEHFAR